MFRLEIHEMLFVYAALCLTVIFLAAVMHNLRRSREERAARRHMLKCRLCSFEFSDTSGAILPRCPNCNALTERKTLSHL